MEQEGLYLGKIIMNKWDIQINFISQPTDVTCVHACLSMVTGILVEELVKRFGNKGLSCEEEIVVLTEMGIFPQQISLFGNTLFPEDGIYMASVPSINKIGYSHRILFVIIEDNWDVIDPNKDRIDKKIYTKDMIEDTFSYYDVIYLKPLRFHKGTELRLQNYDGY